jgi:hypothetical protein
LAACRGSEQGLENTMVPEIRRLLQCIAECRETFWLWHCSTSCTCLRQQQGMLSESFILQLLLLSCGHGGIATLIQARGEMISANIRHRFKLMHCVHEELIGDYRRCSLHRTLSKIAAINERKVMDACVGCLLARAAFT